MAEATHMHEAHDPQLDPTWKLKKKPKKIENYLKETTEAHLADATVQWYINSKFNGVTYQYNQWSAKIWKDLALHLCILDTQNPEAPFCRNYSVRYWGLKKFDPTWIGFYASNYKVKKLIDEAGNTEDVQINDYDELKKIPTLKKGSNIYFAGRQYKMVNYQARDAKKDFGFRFMAEDKSNNEGLYVRKGSQGYVIINYATNNHTTRQNYGSGNAVWGRLHQFVEKCFYKSLDGEYGDGFCAEYEDAEDEW